MDRAFLGQSSAEDGSRLSAMDALKILKDGGKAAVAFASACLMDDL